jgi:hypothetical protein
VLDVLTGRRDEELEAGVAEALQAPDEGGTRTFKWDLEYWPAFVAGDYARCVQLNRQVIATDPLNAPSAYAWAVRSAAWGGDPATARALVDECVGQSRRSGLFDALRLEMEANALGAEGAAAGAEARYREAVAMLEPLGCRFDVALSALDAVVVMGAGAPFGREMAALARPILEELGAQPLLDKLSAAESAAGALEAARPAG